MYKQEVKIEFDGSAIFFFAFNFRTGRQHAEAFVTRNKGKFGMAVFDLNESNNGPKWILRRSSALANL